MAGFALLVFALDVLHVRKRDVAHLGLEDELFGRLIRSIRQKTAKKKCDRHH